MAKEKTEEQKNPEKPEETVPVEKKSKFNTKILLFGIPAFMIQLVVVYFVTANILLDKWKSGNMPQEPEMNVEQTSGSEDGNNENSELGKYVYLEEDVIVNPADTQGKRLLLSSVGFDLGSEENKNAMKEKKILIRDMIISILASKTVDQLNSTSFRDTLKVEISKTVKDLIPNLKVNQVYFSKYIIQ